MMMFRPNTPATTDALDLFDSIQNDVYDALDLIGAQIVDSWQKRISIDVEYTKGPRGGVWVIRSRPGEAPRRETHNLHDSIQQSTEADDGVITEFVDSDVFYAPILEYKMDRPHCEITFEEWADQVVDATIHAIEFTAG